MCTYIIVTLGPNSVFERHYHAFTKIWTRKCARGHATNEQI
jgi:hypothetical protein